MRRKKFIGGVVLSLLSGGVLAIGKHKKSDVMNKETKKGTIMHAVYFWLKEGLSEQEEKDFLRFFAILSKIPGVQTMHYGKPAPTNKRDVVDHSYSYNLLLTFDNLADITVYETHPIHVAAAQEFGKYWKRVEVRDTLLM